MTLFKARAALLALSAIPLVLSPSAASAQSAGVPSNYTTQGGTQLPIQPVQQTGLDAATGLRCLVANTPTCLPDPSNAAFSAPTAMSDGAVYPAGRSIQFECTVAGNVQVTFSGGTARTIPLSVGLSILPYAATKWTVSGVSGPATCTAANLT